MKNYIITILILLLDNITAQTITFENSNSFLVSNKHTEIAILPYNDNLYARFNLSKDNEKDMQIQYFDNSLQKIIKDEIIEMPDFVSNKSCDGIFDIKNNIYYFYSYWDRDNKKDQLKAVLFNKNTNKFNTDQISIAESDKLDGIDYNVNALTHRLDFSKDSSFILVSSFLKKKSKSSSNIFNCNLLDKKLNKIYSSNIELPYKSSITNSFNSFTDSEGEIYVLLGVQNENYIEESNYKKDIVIGYHFELFNVDKKSNSLIPIKINENNKGLSSFKIIENDNGNIVIGFFYSDSKNKLLPDGILTCYIEKDKAKIDFKVKNTYTEFPSEIKNYYVNNIKEKEKNSKLNSEYIGNERLILHDLICESNGNLTYIGQNNYYQEQSSPEHSWTISHFNAILIIKIDGNGNIIWQKKINKLQSGRSIDDLSFKLLNINGLLYFFYIDNISNKLLNIDVDQNQYQDKKFGYLACAITNENGEIKKTIMFDLVDSNKFIYPNKFNKLNKNTFILKNREKDDYFNYFKLEVK